MAIFTARLIFYGFTFGEAACACQRVLSWQTTVLGDPLYRPFGKNPDQLHGELQRRQSKLIEWSWLRLVNLNLASNRSPASCVSMLEALELTKQSAVLSEKLGDLYAAEGKPSSAVFAYSQALKLDASPQQRLRLRLTLVKSLWLWPARRRLSTITRSCSRNFRITRVSPPCTESFFPSRRS